LGGLLLDLEQLHRHGELTVLGGSANAHRDSHVVVVLPGTWINVHPFAGYADLLLAVLVLRHQLQQELKDALDARLGKDACHQLDTLGALIHELLKTLGADF
jgi:hypothetical protein